MRFCFALVLIGSLFVVPSRPSTAGLTPLLPDLVPLPAESLSVGVANDLRFSTVVTNQGLGPMELEGPGNSDVDHTPKAAVQNIYDIDGLKTGTPVGQFFYHDVHHHWHFMPELAEYQLRKPDKTGGWQNGKIVGIGKKATFCFIDLRMVAPLLPGAPASRIYDECGSGLQGISVGWGDVYTSFLPDQSIPLKKVTNGTYWLVIVTDPQHALQQLTTANDASAVRIKIGKRGKRRTVQPLP